MPFGFREPWTDSPAARPYLIEDGRGRTLFTTGLSHGFAALNPSPKSSPMAGVIHFHGGSKNSSQYSNQDQSRIPSALIIQRINRNGINKSIIIRSRIHSTTRFTSPPRLPWLGMSLYFALPIPPVIRMNWMSVPFPPGLVQAHVDLSV